MLEIAILLIVPLTVRPHICGNRTVSRRPVEAIRSEKSPRVMPFEVAVVATQTAPLSGRAASLTGGITASTISTTRTITIPERTRSGPVGRERHTARWMSQENVELVQRLLEVYNERSFEDNVDLVNPEVVMDLSRGELPDGASYTGHSEFIDFVEAWEEGFESEQIEAQEILDAGDRVVAILRHRGRGRLSGIDIDQTFAMVWTLRNGQAVRIELYPTREEALEAVGLPNEAPPS